MKASSEGTTTQAIEVTVGDLTRLDHKVGSAIAPPTYRVTCSDGIDRHFTSLSDLIDFDNAADKAIVALSFRAYSRKDDASFALSLVTASTRNIRWLVEGEEDLVLTLKDALQTYLAGARPAYAVFARTDYTWVLIGLVLLVSLTSILRFGLDRFQPILSTGSVISFLLGFPLVVLGAILNRQKHRLFPMTAFALGQGIKRLERQRFYRVTVLLALVLSILGSLLAAIVKN